MIEVFLVLLLIIGMNIPLYFLLSRVVGPRARKRAREKGLIH